MIDLHVHSCRSDGTFTPTELVDYAIKKGLKAFALTDHDSVDGLDEAIKYAEELRSRGFENVPEIIPGIEFSTEYEGKDIHIVGLYIDYSGEIFKKYIKEFVEAREERNKKMCALMEEDGINLSYEELIKDYPGAVITRAHYAKLLFKKGYVRTREEAFDKYIGDDCKYFIPREKISPEKAIELILKADGIPVLAHPVLYNLTPDRLDKLVKTLKSVGLIAMETDYSTYKSAERKRMHKLADKYHLLSSGGSDFHGSNKANIDLGVGHGDLCIPDEFLEKITSVRKNFLFTDLDGTLLLNNSQISDKMRLSLKNMTDLGHHLIFASGRPLPSIRERIVNLGLNFSNTLIISNNGALIYDLDKKKILSESLLSSDLIRKIVSICQKYEVHIHGYTQKEIVGFEEDEELEFYKKRIHMPFIKTKDLAKTLKNGTYKLQIIDLNNHEKLEKIKDEINLSYSEEVDLFFSNAFYLEVLPKGVNKGSSLLLLEDLLSIPHSHTYAAGDEENDLPMIKAAGTSIAMKNARESLKEAADIVTSLDNDQDGLLEIIEKYFT